MKVGDFVFLFVYFLLYQFLMHLVFSDELQAKELSWILTKIVAVSLGGELSWEQ